MNNYTALFRVARVITAGLMLWASRYSAPALELTKTKTNLVDRWITNLVEVRMPRNLFVDEYRTNWVDQVNTNFVEVYATNWLSRTLPKTVVVQAFQTNFVDRYQTNWNHVRQINDVAVELVQTNFVTRYQTNATLLNLTNWETVLVFKTNWVTQLVTNVVQVDLSGNRPVTPEAVAGKKTIERPEGNGETAASAKPPTLTDGLLIQAAKTGRNPTNNQIEVLLSVKWITDDSAPLLVQQWRVEREDGVVLCFGQDQEFKRQLPPGIYKVQVKVQRGSNSAVISGTGVMEVTTRDAVVRRKLVGMR